MFSVILTGKTLTGYSPETTWTAVARQFKLDPESFRTRVLARTPLSIKQTPDLAEAQRYCAGLVRHGAAAEWVEADGSRWEFRQGDHVRGPLPLAHLIQLHARCADATRVRPAGDAEWIQLAQAARRVPPPSRHARATHERSPASVARSSINDRVLFGGILAATFVVALNFATRQQWVEYCTFFSVSLVGVSGYLLGKKSPSAIPLLACLLVAVLSAYISGGVFAKYRMGASTCDHEPDRAISLKPCEKESLEIAAARIDNVSEEQAPDTLKNAAAWLHKDAKSEAAPDCRHVADMLESNYLQCKLLPRVRKTE